jgi:membrane protein
LWENNAQRWDRFCRLSSLVGLLNRFRVPLEWNDVFRRFYKVLIADNVLGWSAELAYYFFLALFPALLFFVALASFFPIHNLMNQVLGALGSFAPGEVLTLVREQLLQISKNNNGGLLTLGFLGTVWSASSGMSSVISTLNRAYHVDDGRSWLWIRATAILLTGALALFVLVSFALVLVGPAAADTVANWVHLGPVFTWTWKILQWPLVFCLVVTGFGIVYYVGPDVEQEWRWLTTGSVFATISWLMVSLGFRWYVSVFVDYQKTYGAIGGVIVALLWFYVSGLSLLAGAELNAIIEHASLEGKDPGEKVPGEKEKAASVYAAGATVRQSAPSGKPEHSRGSEIVVGAVGLALELFAVVWMHLRRVHRVMR